MDGLRQFLADKMHDTMQISNFMKHLKEQAYDTEVLIEDLPRLNEEVGGHNSVLFTPDLDPKIYRYTQKYIYNLRCMFNVF